MIKAPNLPFDINLINKHYDYYNKIQKLEPGNIKIETITDFWKYILDSFNSCPGNLDTTKNIEENYSFTLIQKKKLLLPSKSFEYFDTFINKLYMQMREYSKDYTKDEVILRLLHLIINHEYKDITNGNIDLLYLNRSGLMDKFASNHPQFLNKDGFKFIKDLININKLSYYLKQKDVILKR